MQDVDDGTKGEMVTGWGVDIRQEAVGMIRRNRAENCVRVRIRFASRKEGQTTKFFCSWVTHRNSCEFTVDCGWRFRGCRVNLPS